MKIGIITLHKVLNFGSALQAFALQEFLKGNGLNTTIIDYRYPNNFHKSNMMIHEKFHTKIKGKIRDLYNYFFRGKSNSIHRFKQFYKTYFNLTPIEYTSINQIESNPPEFDIYITGSDQVWNIKTLYNDPIMFCSFVPKNKKCISFSASFSIKSLPPQYENSIRKHLSKYSAIGVRENSSLEILNSLHLNSNIPKQCTCDPTLLLDKTVYSKIAIKSQLQIKENYILVYLLNYAYNPEPAISIATKQAQKYFGCKIILLGHHKFKYKGNYKYITGVGPAEFIYLFEHAKYIITSSFHGTMFSLIYQKPFISILPPQGSSDCRIQDILSIVDLKENSIYGNEQNFDLNFNNPFTERVKNNIQAYINSSKSFLLNSIFENQHV